MIDVARSDRTAYRGHRCSGLHPPAFRPCRLGICPRRQDLSDARYALAAQESAPYENGSHRGDATTPWHVIWQLASECTSLGLIDDGVEILPGVRAIVTPGHSPGHTTYVITSRTASDSSRSAIGPTPAQLTHPEWLSVADSDTTGVQMARRRLLADWPRPTLSDSAPISEIKRSAGWLPMTLAQPTGHRCPRSYSARPRVSWAPALQLGNAKSHDLSARNASLRLLGGRGRHNSP